MLRRPKKKKEKQSPLSSDPTAGGHWMTYSDLMANLLMTFVVALSVMFIIAALQDEKSGGTEGGYAQCVDDLTRARQRASNCGVRLQQANADINSLRVALGAYGDAGDLEACQSELGDWKDKWRREQKNSTECGDKFREVNANLSAARLALEEYGQAVPLGQKEMERLGIQAQIVRDLRSKLEGKSVAVLDGGLIRIGDSVLFEESSAVLSDEGKLILDQVFEAYVELFFGNGEFKDHLHRIVIEGHTNKRGTYLWNVELSQNRALSVITYLSESQKQNPYWEPAAQKMVASGRSWSDEIQKPDGKHDYVRSRRIEFSFTLNVNQAGIEQIFGSQGNDPKSEVQEGEPSEVLREKAAGASAEGRF